MYYSNEINSAASHAHPGKAFSSNPLARSAWTSTSLHMGHVSAPVPHVLPDPPQGSSMGLTLVLLGQATGGTGMLMVFRLRSL